MPTQISHRPAGLQRSRACRRRARRSAALQCRRAGGGRRLERRHGRAAGRGATTWRCVTHAKNQGYGAALRSAFQYALGQQLRRAGDDRLRRAARAAADSRLRRRACNRPRSSRAAATCRSFDGQSAPPEDRRRINVEITAELNRRLGLQADRRLLRLQGLSPRRPGAPATSPSWATPCRWRCGCRRRGPGCRSSSCRCP